MAIDIANTLPDVTLSQVLITVSVFLAVRAAFSIIWAILDTKFDRKKLFELYIRSKYKHISLEYLSFNVQ